MKQLLWTLQHEQAWNAFEKSGVFVANENYLFCGDEMRYAYDWIAQQMAEKVGPRPRVSVIPSGHGISGKGNANDVICGVPGMPRGGHP